MCQETHNFGHGLVLTDTEVQKLIKKMNSINARRRKKRNKKRKKRAKQNKKKEEII